MDASTVSAEDWGERTPNNGAPDSEGSSLARAFFYSVRQGGVKKAMDTLARLEENPTQSHGFKIATSGIEPFRFPNSNLITGEWPYCVFEERYGDTALHLAVRYRHVEMVEALLKTGYFFTHSRNDESQKASDLCVAEAEVKRPFSQTGAEKSILKLLTEHESRLARCVFHHRADSGETGNPPSPEENDLPLKLQLFYRVRAGDASAVAEVLESGELEMSNVTAGIKPHQFPSEYPGNFPYLAWPYCSFPSEGFGDTILTIAVKHQDLGMVKAIKKAVDPSVFSALCKAKNEAGVSAQDVASNKEGYEDPWTELFDPVGSSLTDLRSGSVSRLRLKPAEASSLIAREVGCGGEGCNPAGWGVPLDPEFVENLVKVTDVETGGMFPFAKIENIYPPSFFRDTPLRLESFFVPPPERKPKTIWVLINGHSDPEQVEYCQAMVEEWGDKLESRGDKVLDSLNCPSKVEIKRTLSKLITAAAADRSDIGIFGVCHGSEVTGAWVEFDPEQKEVEFGACDFVESGLFSPSGGVSSAQQLFFVFDSCFSALMGTELVRLAGKQRCVSPVCIVAASDEAERNFSVGFGTQALARHRALTTESVECLKTAMVEGTEGEETVILRRNYPRGFPELAIPDQVVDVKAGVTTVEVMNIATNLICLGPNLLLTFAEPFSRVSSITAVTANALTSAYTQQPPIPKKEDSPVPPPPL
uniref:Uncharacterized protein n=1 Tax=Chromera velia CCMP2878 TaxID=1169474 RepID=A0A0G4H1S4_9ALVE|eukprot:Cvel_5567.t1-p1 / transcript=Cvel_5567.t1 / gene=Cvel_5567 / organism=Chromera_velia_CCMP2878 / gene_product=hypothetical protein / transcript_product=hypothetical protein / location=Cvel_scaffold261:80795-85681(+) / protein_length=702 / sequence_SO=supercontig / SO=protein_coding / is_pseudo=false